MLPTDIPQIKYGTISHAELLLLNLTLLAEEIKTSSRSRIASLCWPLQTVVHDVYRSDQNKSHSASRTYLNISKQKNWQKFQMC